jgi:hypothetical protein
MTIIINSNLSHTVWDSSGPKLSLQSANLGSNSFSSIALTLRNTVSVTTQCLYTRTFSPISSPKLSLQNSFFGSNSFSSIALTLKNSVSVTTQYLYTRRFSTISKVCFPSPFVEIANQVHS